MYVTINISRRLPHLDLSGRWCSIPKQSVDPLVLDLLQRSRMASHCELANIP